MISKDKDAQGVTPQSHTVKEVYEILAEFENALKDNLREYSMWRIHFRESIPENPYPLTHKAMRVELHPWFNPQADPDLKVLMTNYRSNSALAPVTIDDLFPNDPSKRDPRDFLQITIDWPGLDTSKSRTFYVINTNGKINHQLHQSILRLYEHFGLVFERRLHRDNFIHPNLLRELSTKVSDAIASSGTAFKGSNRNDESNALEIHLLRIIDKFIGNLASCELSLETISRNFLEEALPLTDKNFEYASNVDRWLYCFMEVNRGLLRLDTYIERYTSQIITFIIGFLFIIRTHGLLEFLCDRYFPEAHASTSARANVLQLWTITALFHDLAYLMSDLDDWVGPIMAEFIELPHEFQLEPRVRPYNWEKEHKIVYSEIKGEKILARARMLSWFDALAQTCLLNELGVSRRGIQINSSEAISYRSFLYRSLINEKDHGIISSLLISEAFRNDFESVAPALAAISSHHHLWMPGGAYEEVLERRKTATNKIDNLELMFCKILSRILKVADDMSRKEGRSDREDKNIIDFCREDSVFVEKIFPEGLFIFFEDNPLGFLLALLDGVRAYNVIQKTSNAEGNEQWLIHHTNEANTTLSLHLIACTRRSPRTLDPRGVPPVDMATIPCAKIPENHVLLFSKLRSSQYKFQYLYKDAPLPPIRSVTNLIQYPDHYDDPKFWEEKLKDLASNFKETLTKDPVITGANAEEFLHVLFRLRRSHLAKRLGIQRFCLKFPNNNDTEIEGIVKFRDQKDGNVPLIIFSGAGVSMAPPSSFPGWEGLAEDFLKFLEERMKSNVQLRKECSAAISRARELIRSSSPNIISILGWLEAELGTMGSPVNLVHFHKYYFDEAMVPREANQIHEILWKITNKIVTTNYDTLLKKAGDNVSVRFPLGLGKYKAIPPNEFISSINPILVHLHGALTESTKREDLIVTLQDYRKLYSNPDFRDWFSELTQVGKLLFVGFSLRDEYFMFLLDSIAAGIIPKWDQHYAILPFERGADIEYDKWLLMERYHISPLFYEIDRSSENPHHGLIEMLAKLQRNI